MAEYTRREFIKVAGASVLGAYLLGACSFPRTELLAQSTVRTPEDLVLGRDNWYATLCRQCPAGCGIVVRVVEGRAVKVEGNPLYPVNRGKLCLRGQAALQALYHPDRLSGPQRRVGPRGSGRFEPVSWTDALGELSGRLAELRGAEQADSVLLITPPLRGHLALVVDRFIGAYGGEHLALEAVEDTPLRAAARQALGAEGLPDWDIASARFILSFGADFLSTWLSPVRYSTAYGQFRQGNGVRGTLVQVEPRFSLTAANADTWLPVLPGTEGILALSMAYVIIQEGLGEKEAGQALTGGRGAPALEEFRPQRAQQLTGISAQRIEAVARAFASHRPSLAVAGGSAGGHTNGQFNLAAALALNHLVGSVGREGGVVFNPQPSLPQAPLVIPASPFAQARRLVDRVAGGDKPVKLLMVSGANPIYSLPTSSGFSQAMESVPFVVAFASLMDDTTARADLILPLPTPLEEWGDDVPEPGPGYQVLGLQQPTVYPEHDARSFADLLLELGRDLGMGEVLPWATYKDVLQEGVRHIHTASLGGVDFALFWSELLQKGGWWDPGAKGPAAGALPPAFTQAIYPSFAGEPGEYPYHLIPFPSHSLGEGQGASLPWLQATPDPLTTVTWHTWVEMNAATARQQGLGPGDVVVVESPYGSVEAPVYPHPMMPPWVVSMPLGRGQEQGDSYARGRGANPFSILAPMTDGDTGALAWAATRVRVRKTGRRVRLLTFEGVVPAVELPGAEIIRVRKG